MPTIFRVRCEKLGGHVHMTFFRGEKDRTFQNMGTLVGDVGDYQLLLAALSMGCRHTLGRAVLETTGWDTSKEEQPQEKKETEDL